MTKVTRVLSFFGTVAVLAGLTFTGAHAAQLMYEQFNYPDGALTSNPVWVAHSGAGAKTILVTSGTVKLEQSGGSGEDVNRVFGAQGIAAKTYASFDCTVTAPGVWVGDVYFFHFKDSGTFNFRSRVFVSPAAAGQWTLKFDNDASTPDATWGSALTLGTMYKIVISYDATTGASELWVNPAAESDPKLVSASAGAGGIDIESVALRQAAPSSGSVFQTIDNIKVGNLFTDVVDAPVPATASTFGQIKSLYR
jgi:hypothetical protein